MRTPATRSVPEVGVRMQPRIDSSVVLPLPDGPISSVSSPGTSVRLTPLRARTLPAPEPSSLTMSMASRTGSWLTDSAHRLNTIAGSILVTLTIADSAEMAHMPTVNANSQNARPGVMTIGKAVLRLSTRMVRAIDMPSA